MARPSTSATTLSLRTCLRLCAGLIVAWSAPLLVSAAEAPSVEFNRDVRPILSDHCFPCHGPDRAKRKAGLRLDVEASALANRDGRHAIVPGHPEQSELYLRITADDAEERMPPVKAGRALNASQIETLRRWITQGAAWQRHWSLIPPRRPALPDVRDVRRPRNAIDRFVLARLEREGLTPSPEAERVALIRRATLDLTGLPPTPSEVDAFLADRSPNAYETVIDRLLASPRFGERMAVRWLDAARYADTNGYQTDGERFMWRWRDWVIDAFNRNMPFDQFTIEQLAGDLLTHPTLNQRIATGFNRNHRGNAEGGIIPEEYAVEYVIDRVDTTATVWLGLTMGCARCHDHKFDPITQREFYQVFALFNNVPERGKAIKFGNSRPWIKAPTPLQQQRLSALERRLAEAEHRFAALKGKLDDVQAEWEQALAAHFPEVDLGEDWALTRGLVAHFPFDGDFGCQAGRLATTYLFEGFAVFVPGRLGRALAFDGRRFIDAGDVAGFGFLDKFSIAAWLWAKAGGGGTILSRMSDVPQGDGYAVTLESGKVHVNLVKRWLDDAIRVESQSSLSPGEWHHLVVTYDGSREARGIRLYVDGRSVALRVVLDDLNQSFQTKEPLRVGAGGGLEGRFRGTIDDVRVFNVALTPEEVEVIATPDSIADIGATPPDERTGPQARKLREFILDQHPPASVLKAHWDLEALRQERERLIDSIPTTMVMEELPKPRDSFVLIRGEYDKRGPKVSPDLPACLGRWPDGAPRNRLGFARWLVDPTNPLTARVAVNRAWQMFFGTGLVKTVDDLGSQGEWPTHPDLLDWLATEFVDSGWDVKALHRRIVLSATYRQASRATPALLARDPENRLLARGPRVRLSAEMIRDQALAASGLLVERLGGPSVKPYQPPGLWKELTEADYEPGHGPELYRRSLYTFWKRTVAPPEMMTFDASGRETCVVRETRTNTPLQALTLLNDVTFVEASRVLAQRVMKEGGCAARDRITLAFRLATGRPPRPAELNILVAGQQAHLDHFRQAPEEARRLVTTGESPVPDDLDTCELAAYTAVSSLILNLDETVTKE